MASRSFIDRLWLPVMCLVGLVALVAPAYVVLELLPPAAPSSDGLAPLTPVPEASTKGPRLSEVPAAEPPQTLALPRQSSLQPVSPNTAVPPVLPLQPPTWAYEPPARPRITPVEPSLPTIPQITAPKVDPKAPVGTLMTLKNMDKRAPIMLRVFKQESELEVWKRDKSGFYALLKTYPICRWSGLLGPKVRTGDLQSPEGFYAVTPAAMNPNSAYHLSFNLGFPNAYDRAHGRSGSFLMVHGDCKSVGCYAMTNAQITEIYQLATDAFAGGQAAFQVQAYPFRMTPQNFARHRNSPHLAFWQNLKEGHDLFDITRQPPQAQVCDRRYGFGSSCGSDRLAPGVMAKVAARQKADESAIAALVKRGTPVAPVQAAVATRLDGGTHPSFAGLLAAR